MIEIERCCVTRWDARCAWRQGKRSGAAQSWAQFPDADAVNRWTRSTLGDDSRSVWTLTCASLPFVQRLTKDERDRLRILAAQLLADKQMSAAAGLALTAAMQVSIAVQACLPVLNLGLDWYRGWKSIVVYPSEFLVPRSVTDDDGVVHEFIEPIAGEAWDAGPGCRGRAQSSATGQARLFRISMSRSQLICSWRADAYLPPRHAQTVVARTMRGVLINAFIALRRARPHRFRLPMIDPSDEVDRFYAHLPLVRTRARRAEFFSVASEPSL